MKRLLPHVITLAKQASEKILELYEGVIKVETKIDLTPLTAADLAAHQILTKGLQQLTPQLPVLTEETETIPFEVRSTWQRYWLVDPLDGTKEFIEKNGEFTVNIALIENHQPVLGIVYAPALNICYFAVRGEGAFKQEQDNAPQKIHVQQQMLTPIKITISRRHGLNKLQGLLQQFNAHTILHCGSALKFGLVAEGKADIYPRLGPTSEWDSAAAQCIVEEAGGAVIDLAGNPLRYNTKASLLNPEFLAVGDVSHNWKKYFYASN